MRPLRDALVQAVMGLVGILLGILSAVALALAAVIPPVLGLLALAFAPFRALLRRIRTPHDAG